MKASELRKGNVVIQEGELISGITTNSIHKFDIGQIRLDPVALTHEFLSRLSCERKSSTLFYFDRFRLNWQETYKYWYVTDRHNMTYMTKVEWVHEWQNFIFYTNGQELTLKTK